MFDYVRCEMAGWEGDYQTKCFGNFMDTYTIQSDGILKLTNWCIEKKEGKPWPSFTNEDDMWDRIEGLRHATKRIKRTETVDFHGVLEFYDLENRYEAKFTDGKLIGINAVEESN